MSPVAAALAFGDEDIDTFVVSYVTISETTTTTNTVLITQDYEILGVPATGSTVPEPGSWALAMAGLITIGWWRRRQAQFMRHNRPTLIATSGTLIAALFCANLGSAQPTCTGFCVTSTESTAQINTVANTPLTMQITEYSTQLMAGIQGGSVLYNQTFTAPFSDPTVQAAILAAEGTLTSAGAVSFIGPTLESNNQSLLSSIVNVMQTGSQVTNSIVTSTTYIGPTTIYPGDFGVCQNYIPASYPPVSGCTMTPAAFVIAAGSEDIDTFVVSFVTISETTTTTNTVLITQDYEVLGVPAAGSSVPEPGSWGIALAGLVTIGWWRRGWQRRQTSRPS